MVLNLVEVVVAVVVVVVLLQLGDTAKSWFPKPNRSRHTQMTNKTE